MFSFKRLYNSYVICNREEKSYLAQKAAQSSNPAYYNWWADEIGTWFERRYESYLGTSRIAFCSVFGEKGALGMIPDVKIFFTGENVHKKEYIIYSDHLLSDSKTKLSLGFDCFEHERYIRFPLWILYMFAPNSSDSDIIDHCAALRNPEIKDRSLFCSMIASHDPGYVRKDIVEAIEQLGEVKCAGKYLHNDDSLKTLFGDKKTTYLKQFKFNICPENSNSVGYVTEKVFEAISSGCIPIYWGSYNNPEPGILNQDAIVFWNPGRDNARTISLISELLSSSNKYYEFASQPRLVDGAEEIILGMIHSLDNKIAELFSE